MVKPAKVTYYHNNKALGIKIDWIRVRKEYDKLGIPAEYHDPLKPDFSRIGYSIDLSDRSRGKTTNKLLVGLILWQMYGIHLHYIRTNSRQCEPRNVRQLYDTVLSCGYIDKITGGKYNSISYKGKRWRLQLLDEEGEVLETCPDHCCICFGIDEAPELKSIYNDPLGDLIFFDEFITTSYGYDDFINFTDLCKTIIRDRQSPVIMMSANTINRQSPWFDELGIRELMQQLQPGKPATVSTDLGTHLYIEILSPDISEKRQAVNRRFWGFDNPRLNALTGRGDWATEVYQHIPKRDDANPERVLLGMVYIQHKSTLSRLQLVKHPTLGIAVFVTPAKRTYDDSIIFTGDELYDDRYVWGFGKGTPVEMIWDLYARGRFWYATNGEGQIVKSYVSYIASRITQMRR